MKNGPFIFDSYALLKVFQKEKGYENIVGLLGNIKKTRVTKYMNIINVGEIIYTTYYMLPVQAAYLNTKSKNTSNL
jgi:hypothetical protein